MNKALSQITSYLAVVLIILQACSKDSTVEAPPKPAPPLPDTLSAPWIKVNGFTQIFYDINFVNNNTGFIIGDSGLYKSTDGGYTWQFMSAAIGESRFLSAPSESAVFTVKDDTLFKSFDGGATFDSQKFGFPFISKPFFITTNTGYLACAGLNKLFKTTDGGHAWTMVANTANLQLSGPSTIPFFINEHTGWIADGRSVSRTNGSVDNWTSVDFKATGTSAVHLPFAVSEQIVFVSSISQDFTGVEIKKSVDGGQQYTNLAQLSSSKSDWPDMHFFDENNGYVAAGNRIYTTIDGGVNWSKVVALGDKTVVELHFTDVNHGWACGTDGTILIFKK